MVNFTLTNFKVLSTGNDGGHYYISTQIYYAGQDRLLTVFFHEKADEKKVKELERVEVEGN